MDMDEMVNAMVAGFIDNDVEFDYIYQTDVTTLFDCSKDGRKWEVIISKSELTGHEKLYLAK